LSLRQGLSCLPELKNIIKGSILKSDYLKDISEIDELRELFTELQQAIKDEPNVTVREGNMIMTGYNEELDELHGIIKNSRQFLLELESEEREKTGIKNMKIKYNRVFGYFFEVSKAYLNLVPENYIRKQTTANAERFITDELKVKEELILSAQDKVHELEYNLFIKIVEKIKCETKKLQKSAKKIAQLDCLISFADIALKQDYSKPVMNNDYPIILKNSRHPVIEIIETDYIPNDTNLDIDTRTMIITGPNMAGKSTYMRQVALSVLLAQIGSYVPCESATIGIVDRIFTRVGAHDDLSHGQSTFMVEMNEVSMIINNATSKSLIVMDEIGRGTSTFDGVAIAWSVAEYINNKISAKTLFATHYHVLTKLSMNDGVKNYNISVKEEEDDIIFLRKIIEGGTDKSYGVHVAKLAGMPKLVIDKAKSIQNELYRDDDMKNKITSKNAIDKEDSYKKESSDKKEDSYEKPPSKKDFNKQRPIIKKEKTIGLGQWV